MRIRTRPTCRKATFVELAHVEGGVFLTPRLSVDGMLSWNGVFGSRYGLGLTYAFGPLQGGRPPRHALLVGSRVEMELLRSTLK